MSKKTEPVADSESTAVLDMKAEVEARLKAQAATREQMASGSALISFKGGRLSIDGTDVPSGEVEVIPLAIMFERTFYSKAYNPDVSQVPDCYTYDNIGPHPEAQAPQNPTCKGCPRDAWGSGKEGRGKACREAARLGVISSLADLNQSAVYMAKVPISSLGTVKDFLAYASANGQLTCQYKVRLKVVPDNKSIFKVSIIPLGNNQWSLEQLLPKMNAAIETLNQPYPDLNKDHGTSSKY